ncbi:hypothetical protein BD779DRAFT_1513458 [Infundibulicybe gibba]|nr:hypothetical protein BD779DRAFT_1513458 [Infundibulicybe gibba]
MSLFRQTIVRSQRSLPGFRSPCLRLPPVNLSSRYPRSISFSVPLKNATNTTRQSAVPAAQAPLSHQAPAAVEDTAKPEYSGPLAQTFRRLKIFSLASLTFSFTLAPFMFLIESSLPIPARFALVTIAIGSSGISTALVGWCGAPYVTALRRIAPQDNNGGKGLEMTTLTLGLKPRVTRVYDTDFLVDTKRPFAKWELASSITVASQAPGQEETIAETMNKDGEVLGRWVVTWGENGEGTCRQVGNVVRFFNVHEELL